MSFLDPRLLLAVVLGLAGTAFFSYNAGARHERNAIMAKGQKDVIDTLNHAILENEEASRKMAFDAKEASKNHANELQAIRDHADRARHQRVRVDRSLFCGPSAGEAEIAAPGGDGQEAAAAAFLPEGFTGRLRRAAEKADEITADMRNLIRRAEEANCFQ